MIDFNAPVLTCLGMSSPFRVIVNVIGSDELVVKVNIKYKVSSVNSLSSFST